MTQKRWTKTSIAAELPLVLDDDSSGDGHEQETSGGAAGVFEEPEPDLPVVDPLFEPMPAEVDLAQEIVKLREGVGDLEKVLFHTRLDLQETREIAEKLKFSFTKLKSDPVAFKFFTGITVESFKDILRILGDAVNTMLYAYDVPDDHEGKEYTRGARALSVEDELLLTLVKLRHNFPESDLALRFGISQSTVSQNFVPGYDVCTILLGKYQSGHHESTSTFSCLNRSRQSTLQQGLSLMRRSFTLRSRQILMFRLLRGATIKIRIPVSCLLGLLRMG